MISRGRSMPKWRAARGFAPMHLQAQAPRRARQHVVDDEDGREGDEQADVDARARDVRQHLVERDHARLRQSASSDPGTAP